MLKRHFDNFLTKLIDWWFRVATIERYLIATGVGLLIAIFGGVPLILELLRFFLGAVPEPGLFVQIQLGRLRAPERAVESGCYTALTPKSEIFRV
jgi:hypothetical protein